MSLTEDGTANPASATVRVGWAFAIVFSLHTILGSITPRLEKESAIREMARGWHYALGMAIGVLAVWLLVRWYRDGFVIAPGSLPPALRGWHRLLSLIMPVLPLLTIPLGFLNGWGEGRTIHFVNLVNLPTLMGPDRAVWQFAGYFHSAIGIALVLIALLAMFSVAYSYLRYRKGLLMAFPPGFGFMFLVKSTVFIYAFNSFKERTPGFIAAGLFLAIIAVIWILGTRRNVAPDSRYALNRPGIASLGAGMLALGAVVALAIFAPYLMFRVTPFATGVAIAADPNITWHTQRVADVTIAPPTPYEQKVAQETFKWCAFCHTFKAGAAPLVGPNLHNIFGQRAGTVPNFYYSTGMAKAGQKGLIWNDETIAEFIAGPDKLIPGTSMIVSSGPVTDPKAQAAVVNLLKRATMADAEKDAAVAPAK